MTCHLLGTSRDRRVVLTLSATLMAAIDAHRAVNSKAAIVRMAIASSLSDMIDAHVEQARHLTDTRHDLCRFELMMSEAQSTALRDCAQSNNLTMCEIAELACWQYLAT